MAASVRSSPERQASVAPQALSPAESQPKIAALPQALPPPEAQPKAAVLPPSETQPEEVAGRVEQVIDTGTLKIEDWVIPQ
jgi:hypothetical protein